MTDAPRTPGGRLATVTDAAIAVLGGGDDERAALVAQLAASGLTAHAHTQLDVTDAPSLVVVCGDTVAEIVARIRDVPSFADVPILGIVPAIPSTAATETLAAGATDVVTPSAPPVVLLARCRNLARMSRRDVAGPQALVRINDVLTADGDDAKALVSMLQLTATTLGFDRASLVAHIEGSDHAFVIAASDAEPLSRFTLLIAEYPEVVEAMRTATPVLIDDVLAHPLTAALAETLASRRVRGSAVFPVQWRGRSLGAILLRKATVGVGHLGPRGVELGRLIASITAAHLRHGAVLESLRDQTHRISRARYEAERRLRGIDSLKEHFDAGADGVVVLDDNGRILFVNRAAERITGFARDGLLGSELVDLVPERQRAQITDAIARVLAGTNVDAFDLALSTTSGTSVWASVSTSTVLAGTGAVILSFRDVTAERALEHELRSTKEFLERLIDSTVDAIIAADMRGMIILFNQGAERLFGYRARDVIAKKPVWELYEPGGAKQIMRMLRATSYGGVGRLEQTRREVRIAGNEVVPVSMTASIVYEGEREVATVGILTDLRERIRMEQRLLDAQQKLQLSEKQALVAELAGAAAHELNQPLTSIMGYAQLIERQSDKEAQHMRAGARDPVRGRAHGGDRQEDRTHHEVRDHRLRRGRPHARSRSRGSRPLRGRAAHAGDRRRAHRRVHRGGRSAARCARRAATAAVARRGAARARLPRARAGGQAMIPVPSEAAQLAALRELASALPFAVSEQVAVDRALDLLVGLFPQRAFAVRVLDVRNREPARAYARNAALRDGVSYEGVTFTQDAVTAARLKTAVAASARVSIRERWDSPFLGMANGMTVALAGAGELYGALDVGYAPGVDRPSEDAAALAPLASALALALRALRLQEDAIGLRDYQARLLDSANALILGVDRAWRITVCNRALLELVGGTRDEVLGRDVRDFLTPDQRQGLMGAFASALGGQHHAAITVMLPTRNGLVRTVWSIAPVGRAGQPGGPVEAVVAIGQDQSKIDLLQQQVVRTERLATLGELAAGVVHELNNPLTSITVYAEYLVRKGEAGGMEDGDVEKLRRIGASAQRILRFSRDLVQYARPSGKEHEAVDLAAVVRQSVSICEHLVERGGIALEVDVAADLPVVYAVSGQLEQVLINLITNAVHAIEGGVEDGGKVIVRARPDGDDAVVLQVADTGPGVPEPQREKIFEPFFTTKADGKGTGLGLPIVRNIVEQHRGQISVDRSELGGAQFRVKIPIGTPG